MPLYVEIVNHTPMISNTVDTCIITPELERYGQGHLLMT